MENNSTQSLYKGEEDQSIYNKDDTRKNRLTLKQINHLRKIREMKRLEIMKDSLYWELMYGAPSEDDDGGGGGGPF